MCFSLGWIEQVLIRLVILLAVVGIIKLLLPYLLAQLGAGGAVIIQALKIVLWAVVAIFVIIVCFDLISCLLSAGGGFSLMPRR